jgi:putative hydrolase of the HAD superfamily
MNLYLGNNSRSQSLSIMKPTTLFFDLDNTNYSPFCGLWEAISQRISEFMTIRMRIPSENVISIRQYCRKNFGTTLLGLKSKYELNEDDYLQFVHEVDLSCYIHPNLDLNFMLDSLPQRKIIFTNSILTHAERVLATMGITHCFDQIIDFYEITPYSKLQKDSFLIALNKAHEPFPQNCVIIDDSFQVLEIAHQMNFICINPWNTDITHHNIISIPVILDLTKAIESINAN